jgi:hypothetical protein
MTTKSPDQIDDRGNVVPCCKTCNNAKKQLLPMEWEKYLDKLHKQDGNIK